MYFLYYYRLNSSRVAWLMEENFKKLGDYRSARTNA
jgi:hypothetical protein